MKWGLEIGDIYVSAAPDSVGIAVLFTERKIIYCQL